MGVALIVAVVLIGVAVIRMYNDLVQLRNRVRNQWAQVDVQLKRRFDLIPNLVETVKGAAAHERGTLEAVVAARGAVMGASTPGQKMEAEGRLQQTLGRLMALAESYPDLKANQNYLELQRELQEVESKIAYARQFYNDTVMKYQDKRQMFPFNMVASVFGFREEPYFEVQEMQREAVRVEL